MTEAHNIKVKNRLGEMMRQPGGRSLTEALRGAEKRLERNHGEFLAALDRAIARMEAGAAGLNETPNAPAATEVYQAANDMIAMADLVGFAALDELAHGLCDLIDVLRADGVWSDDAIRVHVDAVQLLRGLAPDDDVARERVLEGLRKIWVRFGVEIRRGEPARG